MKRAIIIAVLGVLALFLSAGLSNCASGQSPGPVKSGNMSWDQKTYVIDESSASSILAFVEFLSLGVGRGIPLDQLDDTQKSFAAQACSPFKPAGMTLNRQTGSLKATCMYIVTEERLRASGTTRILAERGWEYKGKVGTRHIFKKAGRVKPSMIEILPGQKTA